MAGDLYPGKREATLGSEAHWGPVSSTVAVRRHLYSVPETECFSQDTPQPQPRKLKKLFTRNLNKASLKTRQWESFMTQTENIFALVCFFFLYLAHKFRDQN